MVYKLLFFIFLLNFGEVGKKVSEFGSSLRLTIYYCLDVLHVTLEKFYFLWDLQLPHLKKCSY